VTDGVVTSITVNNGGYYYQAAPYVEILGNGAGARAVAVVGTGSVSSIDVIDGGNGYLPIQFGSSVSATVMISNGKVQNLQYR
jgi:hypothetical protein